MFKNVYSTSCFGNAFGTVILEMLAMQPMYEEFGLYEER